MKKILQVIDGAGKRPVVDSSDMKRFVSIVAENNTQKDVAEGVDVFYNAGETANKKPVGKGTKVKNKTTGIVGKAYSWSVVKGVPYLYVKGDDDRYQSPAKDWLVIDEQGVSEGIRVVDQDYDLDQVILTLDIEGRRASFTYTDYDENFENAERRDVFDQLQEKSWYKGLDHPTKMEILDAAYKAIRGEEPSEYKPRVDDEPLDIDEGVVEGLSFRDYLNLAEAKKKITASEDPCWKGYKMVGTKKKGGREVPNCVPGKKGD